MPQTKTKNKLRSHYVRIKNQDTYHHMLNESQQKPKPWRQHTVVSTRKRQDETNGVQIEIEKR